MAGKQRDEAEAAVGTLLELAAADPNHVMVLLALAHGFMLLKQARRGCAGPGARGLLAQRIPPLYYPLLSICFSCDCSAGRTSREAALAGTAPEVHERAAGVRVDAFTPGGVTSPANSTALVRISLPLLSR